MLQCFPESHRKSVTADTQRSTFCLKDSWRFSLWLALASAIWKKLSFSVKCDVTQSWPIQNTKISWLSDSWILWRQRTCLGLYLLQEPCPLSYTLFLALKPITYPYSDIVCLIPHPWVPLKAFCRRPCQELSSDPSRPQEMDIYSPRACGALWTGATVPILWTVSILWTSQVSPYPYLISCWFGCCNSQGPQPVEPFISRYASVFLSADVLPPDRGNK